MKPESTSSGSLPSRHADDAWLERWLPLLREHTGERCVLELGCGTGRDTAVLRAAGLRVVAIDRSPAALAEARQSVPGATFIESDLRAPLPIDARDVGAIVASLSLHYFDWQTTRQIVEHLRLFLTPHRPLLCRVNSTRDVHYGSTGHPARRADHRPLRAPKGHLGTRRSRELRPLRSAPVWSDVAGAAGS